jgi:hypothetical protein
VFKKIAISIVTSGKSLNDEHITLRSLPYHFQSFLIHNSQIAQTFNAMLSKILAVSLNEEV